MAPHSTLSLAAIVLAGGQSTRMGQDKALLSINGVPLLRRVCDAALHCTPTVYVITFQPDRYRAIVPASCHLLQEHLQPGETVSHGPLIGFAQALEHVQTDWVLLLACDLPHLTGDALQPWLNALTQANDAIALLPQSANGWEPLCGFYRTRCLPRLQTAIRRGDRSFQRWLTHESVKALPLHTPHILFNCNTPQDLAHVSEPL